jgi:hypothetical protein
MTHAPADCAANGGPTISRVTGCINDEMRECIVCRNSCLWSMTEHSFFGFRLLCPHAGQLGQEADQ